MNSVNNRWYEAIPREPSPSRARGRPGGIGKWIPALIIAAVVLLIAAIVGNGIYTEWLWFGSLGYSSVYLTMLKTQLLLFLLGTVVFVGLLMTSIFLARRLSPASGEVVYLGRELAVGRRILEVSLFAAALFLGIIFGISASSRWETVLRYLHGMNFGTADPIFGRDAAFYIFDLSIYRFAQGWLISALIIIGIFTALVYAINLSSRGFALTSKVKGHFLVLGAAIFLLIAWSYWLDIYDLVSSRHDLLTGASYTDVHARLLALRLLIGAAAICALLLVINIFLRRMRLALVGIGFWLGMVIIVGGIYPATVQRFQVAPNELAKESPYIRYNIDFTQQAYALDRIEEKDFPAEEVLTLEDIQGNLDTINNIRLWDHRPLKDTYRQKQAIRLYYDFNDVDVDRYTTDGRYRQVMLSARELLPENLEAEAQTWVNQRLVYTHGYGAVLSPVTEFTGEGLPVSLVKDIPPTGVVEITRPEIYYGERTNNYVIVNTNTREFDYPKGDENVYGKFAGGGGVELGSFIRKLAFAWKFGDINIILSGELGPKSQLLYRRHIQERIHKAAPFLLLDQDPYLVIAQGRLFWIQDAYTVSGRFPYSQPWGDFNYIRNSVKAVVNAYDGSVTLYIADSTDALIQTYQSIFPVLFSPIDEMPQSLREHIRYPEDLFLVQAQVYQRYHMKDVKVFYGKEDLWAIPKELYYGAEQQMEPYYIIIRLPEESEEEFLLMLPFTPANKKNTIGWLAARSDGDNYGKLLAYKFPKDKLVYGPAQIENRINQETTITEQFALWSRGGARFIQGNLLLIPIGDSLLYVEPIFLQAQAGGLPELKRVIVATAEQAPVMHNTLQESLSALFGGVTPPATPPTTPFPTPPGKHPTEVAELVELVQQTYANA
ncbi:MAG: UPF0182 family protein, partial [Dehalococcoidia bacterium]